MTTQLKYQVHPNGNIYWRVVQVLSTTPWKERTVKTFGANPPLAVLKRACRTYGCRLPKIMRGRSAPVPNPTPLMEDRNDE